MFTHFALPSDRFLLLLRFHLPMQHLLFLAPSSLLQSAPAHLITPRSHSLSQSCEAQGLRFISSPIFLRDWYLHTQIHTKLVCGAGRR